MRTAKEVLKDSFEKYLANKTIGRLEGLREFINKPGFRRLFEGGFHFEEEARYFTEESIAKLQAFKDFIKSPEFQKILREGGLKDEKVVKHLRENTIVGDSIDHPQFQNWIKPALKEDPEVQSIIRQVDEEFAEIERLGFTEWKDRIEEEKRKKEESTKPKVPDKGNPKKWMPIDFRNYLKDPSTNRLTCLKEYIDRPGVQVELKGEFKDDEELQSIASQVNKLWDNYQKDEEERKKRFIEDLEKVEQDRMKYQMEQREEEKKRRDSKIYIPIFD